jgi:hypothetical protein
MARDCRSRVMVQVLKGILHKLAVQQLTESDYVLRTAFVSTDVDNTRMSFIIKVDSSSYWLECT